MGLSVLFFHTNCPVIIKGNKKTKAKEQKTVTIKIAHIPSAASHSTANLWCDVESQNKAQMYLPKLFLLHRLIEINQSSILLFQQT